MRKIAAWFLAIFMFAVCLNASAQTTVYYQPTPYPAALTKGLHILDGWLPSYYYNQEFQATDGRLQVGGWGDIYRTYLLFDLEGLPKVVSDAKLRLYAYPRGDASTLVDSYVYRPTTSWTTSSTELTTSMSWSNRPSMSLLGTLYAGSVNSWWNIDVTSLYGDWQDGSTPNYGIALDPYATDNRFNVFRSSRYSNDAHRPMLQLTFSPPVSVPNFKIPLPRNISWLVTTEVGGWDCIGSATPLVSHTGINYFSIDFSWRNKDSEGDQVYGNPTTDNANIPILAAADGVVKEVISSSLDPNFNNNGYMVAISHDSSGDIEEGFSTRYLHFKSPPLVALNEEVSQGDVLGYMGETGIATAPHLHFGVRYNYSGASNTNAMYATMSGLLLKSYQSECSSGNYIRYYLSQ